MEQCSGPFSVEIVPGKHCDFSTYLAQRARNKSGACAEVKFPDYGKVLWSSGSRNGSTKAGKLGHSSTYLTQRERELSLALAQRCIFLNM
jgi:hypothetical protein